MVKLVSYNTSLYIYTYIFICLYKFNRNDPQAKRLGRSECIMAQNEGVTLRSAFSRFDQHATSGTPQKAPKMVNKSS